MVQSFANYHATPHPPRSGQVKVKVTDLEFSKFLESRYFSTKWWILFLFGIMIDTGQKFLSAPSTLMTVTLWSRSQTKNLNVKVFIMMIHIGPKFCTVPSHTPRSGQGQGHRIIKVFRISLLLNQMMDLVPICYHDRYWSNVFISTINTHDWPCGRGYRLRIQMFKFSLKFFKTSLFSNLTTRLIHLWYVDTYWSKIFPSSIPIP